MHGLVDEELKAAELAEEWGGHRAMALQEVGLAAYDAMLSGQSLLGGVAYDQMQQQHFERQAQLYQQQPQYAGYPHAHTHPPQQRSPHHSPVRSPVRSPGRARSHSPESGHPWHQVAASRSPVQDTRNGRRPTSWQRAEARVVRAEARSHYEQYFRGQRSRSPNPSRKKSVAFQQQYQQQAPTPPSGYASSIPRSAPSPTLAPPPPPPPPLAPAAQVAPTWPPDLHARLHAEHQSYQRPLQRVASALTHSELYNLHQRMLASQGYSQARQSLSPPRQSHSPPPQRPLGPSPHTRSSHVPPLHSGYHQPAQVRQAISRVENAWNARARAKSPVVRAPTPPAWRP